MSNDKPRMIQITDPREIADFSKPYAELDHPNIISDGHGKLYCDADELKAWRASQRTSTGDE